uniref:phosphoenolpyruvate carboxykinase (ATP) n=1 Tax=Chlamydomonas chlamydogama TaxID=225041 RepID=A0A7S2QT75_9CHLO|mmetsp:Transcript_1598/g.3594  ORF Transcript_1598/g.3594 Transcript_1598/m.3594 type:complete len:629 (+) Transcript_1598:176-2062(+)
MSQANVMQLNRYSVGRCLGGPKLQKIGVATSTCAPIHRARRTINYVKTSTLARQVEASHYVAVTQQLVSPVSSEVRTEGHDVTFLLESAFSRRSGLKPKSVWRNLSPSKLYEMALQHEPGTCITSSGALATTSGSKTGRSPKDKHVVVEAETTGEIWRGGSSPNHDMQPEKFTVNRDAAVEYLNSVDRVYVVDAYANWDPKNRYKIRILTTRAYHALFMHNMLIRPTDEELAAFGEPDFVIYNAGACPAPSPKATNGTPASPTSVDVSITNREMVILGTQYAGEMKKGVFSIMNYLMPKKGILSMHSGCNVGREGDVTLFFGLSGTGKTTLSTDPARPLIGDDEHCWGDDGVFNIEGGCYAKCINLQESKEPEIFRAIRFGTILENVVFDERRRIVDFDSSSITENTRACYPIDFIDHARIPCVGPHPRNVILLCCDAFGVLPPVSKLSLEQAMYHFVSGYTAKVAGTEQGVKEPEATFSACFGAAFLMWHPMKYAAMLCDKMKQHGTTAWLINTGWTGGRYGVGSRISLKYTRAIVDAIHSEELAAQSFSTTPIFGLQVPAKCPGVPAEVLQPESSWSSKKEFTGTLQQLGGLFVQNFVKFLDGDKYVGAEMVARMLAGGPQLAADE